MPMCMWSRLSENSRHLLGKCAKPRDCERPSEGSKTSEHPEASSWGFSELGCLTHMRYCQAMKANMRTGVLAGQINALAVEGKSDVASCFQKVESKLYDFMSPYLFLFHTKDIPL